MQPRCKACQYAWRKTDSGKKADRKYKAKPHVKAATNARQRAYSATEKGKQIKIRHNTKHPEKAFARSVLQLALRMGQISKPESCDRCGEIPPVMHDGRSSIQGHHSDYAKPLDIEWLCIPCHKKADRECGHGN